MFQKIFTPQEAARTLPLVKKIVSDILEKGTALKAMIQEYPTQELPKEGRRLENEINNLMLELEEIGCFFKDWNFEIGLVDFPAIIDEKIVFLCWRSDEPQIQWYHPIETGYADRKPIPETFLVS